MFKLVVIDQVDVVSQFEDICSLKVISGRPHGDYTRFLRMCVYGLRIGATLGPGVNGRLDSGDN